MIDIEEELIAVQIKHIQKELEQLWFYYNEVTDLGFLHFLCGYKKMLELLAELTDERYCCIRRCIRIVKIISLTKLKVHQ